MTDLDKQIFQKATGETRLNPDQQRQYLGTFAERVILAIPLSESKSPEILEKFPLIFKELIKTYNPVQMKLSGELGTSIQMSYLKLAQKEDIPATTVNETSAHSPYGLVLHTSQAINLPQLELANRFDYLFTENEKSEKKSFFQRLFHQ